MALLAAEPYRAAMPLGDLLDVAQAKPEAFDVVAVAVGDAIESLEDAPLMGGRDADAVVLDLNVGEQLVRFQADGDVRLGPSIFHGVVDQVLDRLAEMQLVGDDGAPVQLVDDPEMDLLARLEGDLPGELVDQRPWLKRLLVKTERLSLIDRHAQYLLHQAGQVLELLLAEREVLVPFRLVVDQVVGLERIDGRVGDGDRRLQLVCHVVHEVVLDLGDTLLPEDRADQVGVAGGRDERQQKGRPAGQEHPPVDDSRGVDDVAPQAIILAHRGADAAGLEQPRRLERFGP